MNTTTVQQGLAGKEQPYTYLCPLRQIGIGLLFCFQTSNQAEDATDRLHNRRACSALWGIGVATPTRMCSEVITVHCLLVYNMFDPKDSVCQSPNWAFFYYTRKFSILRLTRKEYAMDFAS